MSRSLLIASPGGHLDELYDLAPGFHLQVTDALWVTAATPQTRCVLAGERVEWVSPIASREGCRALRRLPAALALVRRHQPSIVISTGAALAWPYLVAAWLLRVETHYVESATRVDGPSLTGRMMALLPGVQLHHQAFRRPVPGWQQVASVFDSFVPGPARERQVRKVVVVLGTERYPFPRAVTLIQDAALSPGVDVLIQTGHTTVPGGAAGVRTWVPYDELLGLMAAADVVVTHAGVGTVLSALRLGKHPVVLPRVARFAEHADDHQTELADALGRRGLVTVPSHDDFASCLREAAAKSTLRIGRTSAA